ncbi:hypothetical protein [Dyella caseinilytica]|uniref:MSHA biogenesis protein MshC n=1 Tax=Dyella caseinilytica TaxID=1849581 RepID=A0ABX7GYP6_9GAMM|nr:hypothetical protein [Dyella caseinilytica]QRN55630.1 hypothetical protein ISN74_10060 [Dyella caseinilytica]
MSIIGAGTAYISAHMAVSAKNVRVNGAAVTQMRMLLQQYGPGLCSGASDNSMATVILPGSLSIQQINVQCSTSNTVAVGGISVSQPTSVVLCAAASVGNSFEVAVKVGSNSAVTC